MDKKDKAGTLPQHTAYELIEECPLWVLAVSCFASLATTALASILMSSPLSAVADSSGLPTRSANPRNANFTVRICHLSHLKSSNELGLLISFLRWDLPLQFNNGGMG